MTLFHILRTYIVQSSDVAFLTNPKTLAHESLQDLAATALRQLGFRELDVAGDFVVGEESSAMCNQIIGAEISSGLAHHACRYELAPLRVRHSEDRCFQNRGMLVNNR